MRASSGATLHLRDVLVLIFIALLVPTAGLRVATQQKEQSNRVKCAQNLRKIGLAMQLYANDNRGAFPRVRIEKVDEPVPTEYTGVGASNPFAADGPAPSDVSAGLFLLARYNDGADAPPEVFVCPSAAENLGATPFAPPAGSNVQAFSNFSGRRNLSYGYSNPYPGIAARSKGFKLNIALSSDFAVGADMGPGPIAATLPHSAKPPQMKPALSPNHANEGQNVLYADGHVDWTISIFSGMPRPDRQRDNIYAFGETSPSAGTHGSPKDQYDSVILPSFDLGPQPSAPARGNAAAAVAAAKSAGWNLSGMLLGAVALAVVGGGVAVLVWFLAKSKQPRRY